jgi:GNAT superfamily N-acetyltransferase
MKLVYLATPQQATTEAIRSRSVASSKGQITRHYAAWENGEEVALVAFDIYDRREFPDVDYLVVYELYVPEGLRNKGIGTRALQAAEQFAKDLGFRKTMLHAKPLFETRTQVEMIAWYQRRGYVQAEGRSSDLQKIL